MRLIRVMCSGRVDLKFVLKAFLNGMDGVFVGGCRLNECNYITHGNYHALNTVLLCKKIMEHVGLDPQRLRIEFMSSGDGIVLAEVMNDFVKKVRSLGPLGKGEGLGEGELKFGLEEALKLTPYMKMVKREKLRSRLNTQEEREALFAGDEIDALFSQAVSYHIDPERCQACMICLRKCPVEAIAGGKNRIHVIDQEKCIRCGTCFEACPPRFDAVREISGAPVPPPLPEAERTIVRKSKQG